MAMLAIGLFILFDIAGLSLNYLLSWRIEQQAIGINLAGRQRMLSQRMVKTLLQIDAARRTGEPVKPHYDELKLTFDLFDNTLRGFDVGNETKGGAGEALFLPAVTEPKARKAVSDAVALWKDYRVKVAGLLATGELADEGSVRAVLAEARARNLKLLALMNDLTTELEIQTQQEAQRIRTYQVVVFVLALGCCFWAFQLFRRREAEIQVARQMATEAAHVEREYVAALVSRATQSLQTAENLPTLTHQFFAAMATPLGLGCATFFIFDPKSAKLTACGHYGLADGLDLPQQIALDEGLVGECARAQRCMVISDLPESHIKVRTSLMTAAPRTIVLLPVVSSGVLLGVIEMALLKTLEPRDQEALNAALPFLAMRIELIARMERTINNLTSTGDMS